MFIRIAGTLDCGHVQSCFVSKRRRTHVGSLRIQWTIEYFGNVIAHRGNARQVAFWQTAKAHLQLKVRNHRGEVGVTRALTQAIQRALHVTYSGQYCCH